MTVLKTSSPHSTTLRDLIADDAYIAGFQTVGQYRAALLKHDATHAAFGAVTNDQITAGAAVKCECGKPLGRNVAIDVHDAMERSKPYATGGTVPAQLHLVSECLGPFTASVCTCPSGDGSLRWPCSAHPPASQAATLGERQEGGAA